MDTTVKPKIANTDTVVLEITWTEYNMLMDLVKKIADHNPKSPFLHELHKKMYMNAKVIKNKS
jgi:hypothetical protein